jgi:Tfp pilus assembly protein PilF
MNKGGFAEAARLHREAIRLSPTSVEALSNLGITLLELGRLDEAEAACRKALRLNPKFAAAHSNLGLILTELGAFEEGEEHLRQALALTPDHERSLANLANALVEQGRFADAMDCYRDIVRLHPDSADAKANLGIMLLRDGRFEEGWQFYQSRRDVRALTESYRHRAGSTAPWSGEIARERLLIVHAEQGFGDVIQFCRYLPMAAERVRVVVQAPATLHRLLATLPGVEGIVEPGNNLVADFYCSMLSLPFLLGTTLENIPETAPYLRANAAAKSPWRDRLSRLPGLKVGLAWSGRSTLSMIIGVRSIRHCLRDC